MKVSFLEAQQEQIAENSWNTKHAEERNPEMFPRPVPGNLREYFSNLVAEIGLSIDLNRLNAGPTPLKKDKTKKRKKKKNAMEMARKAVPVFYSYSKITDYQAYLEDMDRMYKEDIENDNMDMDWLDNFDDLGNYRPTI